MNTEFPLYADITRCYGDGGCEDKEQCARFMTMKFDPPLLLSYTLTLRMDNNTPCEQFILYDDL
jgi:hypothetical protein